MNQLPTLIIGIGGIGCRIAASIDENLSAEDRNYVSVIGIDTDLNEITTLHQSHDKMKFIQTSDNREAGKYLENNKEYSKWFPDNEYLRNHPMKDGAGQVRALSRLVFLSCAEELKLDSILTELTRIQKVGENAFSGNVAITIVGSITGGTGAGIFLQLPFYLREQLKKRQNMQCTIKGIFVGSDITEGVNSSKIKKDAVCVNAYTCLKELNAFYLNPQIKISERTLDMEFFDKEDTSITNIPYDYTYLVELSNAYGAVGDATLSEIVKYIGRAAYTLLFTPVGPNAKSAEDNHVMALIQTNGMNRYAGLGMCRLRYPLDQAKKYVTYVATRELVSAEWLLIDSRFDGIKKDALFRQKSNRTEKIPTIDDYYVKLFEEEATGPNAHLGHLAGDAYNEKDHKAISKGIDYVKNIRMKTKELLEGDEIKKATSKCRIDPQKMKHISEAKDQVHLVWNAMGDLSKLARNLVADTPGKFANDMFPCVEDSMKFGAGKPECIYTLLSTAHPVAARFLIYDIILRLKDSIKNLKKEIGGGQDILFAYSDRDFDAKKQGIQKPSEVINDLEIKVDRIPLWGALGDVGSTLSGETSGLNKIRMALSEASEEHVSGVINYIDKTIQLETANILLERMQELARYYEVFFDAVKDRIKQMEKEVDNLENLHFPFGEEGIYCSKEAFRRMADQYLAIQMGQLSKETKKAVFDSIFHIQSVVYTKRVNNFTDKQISQIEKEGRNELGGVFEKAILKTIGEEVTNKGYSIVDITAKEALAREFELKSSMIKDEEGYEEALETYVKERVRDALKEGIPMLATTNSGVKDSLNYLALSPENAACDTEGKADAGETQKFYIDSFEAQNILAGNVGIIIDEEFDKTELVCLEMNYNYSIENLTKYQDGSRNEIAYRTRIANLMHDGDDVSVVNPHLNKYWHEIGFTPSIQKANREKDQVDNRKAFIYAIGMNLICMFDDDENPLPDGRPRPTWEAVGDMFTLGSKIKKCGKLIENEYSDVFNALPYNGILRRSFLQDANRLTWAFKRSSFTEELFEGILENGFVYDLCHPGGPNKKNRDENIFDVFISMKSHMDNDEWDKLVDTLLAVLWEFCGILFDEDKKMVNDATRKILAAIYENCELAKKSEETFSSAERSLKKHYDNFLSSQYKSEGED